MRHASLTLVVACVTGLVLQGCAEDPSAARPIAVAGIEIVTNPSSRPDPAFVATCQTGAIVRLSARGSSDPGGRGLSYQWTDRVDGVLTPDFGPGKNPLRTGDEETGVLLATVGSHDLELQITAASGAKASTTLRVLVTSCEDCGGP